MPATPHNSSSFSSPDVLIIGAGLSGLAAAVRLAMFGKKVTLFEKHYVVGGLNSFYARKGRKFDVGLHALTNYPSQSSGKISPLLKLCRQLRISIDQLNLLQQSHSRITFADCSLKFNNEFPTFLSQVEEVFPASMDAFNKLLFKMEEFPAYKVDAKELSTREILSDSGIDPLLAEMLLCPTCYYGSARPNDIDFPTFIMLFDAIFRQGLSRRKTDTGNSRSANRKLKELGVDRRMNCAVESIHVEGDQVSEVILSSGNLFRQIKLFHLWIKRLKFCSIRFLLQNSETGEFSVIESIRVMDGTPEILDGKKL